MKAVIYARFSSSSQREESIEGQLKVCKDYAKREKIKIVGNYIDKAKSASKDLEKRVNFHKMIKDSSKQKFDCILVYSLDRFSRNKYENATYKAKLKENGVKVMSATEPIGDDATGVLMESLLEGMAAYYSMELSQKIDRGLNTNAEKCLVNGSLPIGYKAVDKHYVVDDDKAIIIRKIFEMYLNDSKMVDICTHLNSLGYRTKTGVEFKVTSINKILQNKRYAGYYIYRGVEVEDGIPNIITKEQFEDVAKKMAKNRKRSSASKAIGEQYLLTTKLFCGYCETGMRGTSGTGKLGKLYQYYACANQVNKKTRTCNKKRIGKQQIENLVVDLCYRQLSDENIRKITDEVMAICEQDKDTNNYAMLKNNLKNLEKQKKNLIKSLKIGSRDENFQAMIYEEFKSLEKQEIEIQKEMDKEENLQNTLTREHILFFLNDLRQGDIKDFKYRQMLVDIFINKIYIYDDKLKIVFTTQDEKIEVDLDFLKNLEGSYLKPSTKWK